MAKLIINDEKQATNERNIQFVKENYEYKKRMYLNVKFLIHPLFIYAKCCCKQQHLILRLLT